MAIGMDDLKALKEGPVDVEEAVVAVGVVQGLEIVVEGLAVEAVEGKDAIVVAPGVDLVVEVGNVTDQDPLLDVKIVPDHVPVVEKTSLNRQLQQEERISLDQNLVLGQNHPHLLIDDGNLALGLAAHQKHVILKKLFQKGLLPEVEVVLHLDRTMTENVLL